MNIDGKLLETLKNEINPQRLRATAMQLVDVPSPTGQGRAVADRLAGILASDGFDVERPDGGWAKAPAVAVRFDTGRPGKTLQFNGHLDTVHLPFVPPRIENGLLFGSGAIDMKGGVAAAVEALRVLRDTGALKAGGVLLTAHDLHEAPWGDNSQLEGLIEAGYVGDGVLIPEYTSEILPVIGRGMAILDVTVRRPGQPVHEVLGGIEQPNVITIGADIIRRFGDWHGRVSERTHPSGLQETVFIGQVHSGEIYNQSPTEFRLTGTRRWLPETETDDVRREFHDLLAAAEEGTGTQIEGEFRLVRDAFELPKNDWLVDVFQATCKALGGSSLPTGVKPFCDDGNTFFAHGVPCITHGPAGSGAHTLNEQVSLSELERVALYYAATAAVFCDA